MIVKADQEEALNTLVGVVRPTGQKIFNCSLKSHQLGIEEQWGK